MNINCSEVVLEMGKYLKQWLAALTQMLTLKDTRLNRVFILQGTRGQNLSLLWTQYLQIHIKQY